MNDIAALRPASSAGESSRHVGDDYAVHIIRDLGLAARADREVIDLNAELEDGVSLPLWSRSPARRSVAGRSPRTTGTMWRLPSRMTSRSILLAGSARGNLVDELTGLLDGDSTEPRQ